MASSPLASVTVTVTVNMPGDMSLPWMRRPTAPSSGGIPRTRTRRGALPSVAAGMVKSMAEPVVPVWSATVGAVSGMEVCALTVMC